MGMNKPHKNIMGNLKKLEKVWASNTSLTETAINKPRKVEVTAIRITPDKTTGQLIPDKSTRKEASSTWYKSIDDPEKYSTGSFCKHEQIQTDGG